MRMLALTILCSAFPALCSASAWCDAHGGQAEKILDDGTRADCITEHYAIEVERDPLWYQAVGQSLWYAKQTGLHAGVVLIAPGPDGDRHWRRLQSLVEFYDLPIRLWRVTAD